MNQTKINTKFTCPCCGSKLDGATSIDGKVNTPKTGDLSICIYCGTCLEYMEGGASKLMNWAELNSTMRNTMLSSLATLVMQIMPEPKKGTNNVGH